MVFSFTGQTSRASSNSNHFSAAHTSESVNIEQAILDAIKAERESLILFLLYDTRLEKIKISPDNLWATAWLVPVDPQTGLDVPAEPGLAVVRKMDGSWQAILPSDSRWKEYLEQAPLSVITEDMRTYLLNEMIKTTTQVDTTYTGFKLPWAAGETMALTQSTAHDRYTPDGYAHYAFDFAKPGYPSGMFNVHAAKSAVVKKAVWTYENGSETIPGNYLLLEDNSTVPTTFHLYLHFAKDTIPLELRTFGARVEQGQFIGLADDTGMSSGNHLHFMVHTYASSYWGKSVDIAFSDVAINAGRPRIPVDEAYCYDTDPCEVFQYTYVSGNTQSSDTNPPQGWISAPAHNFIVTSSNLHLEGWAEDEDSGLAQAQFKAKYNDTWHLLGEPFSTSPFATDWDLCADQVPDGPVTLALELLDNAGNTNLDLPGLTQITKNFTCPQPAPTCNPDDDQITLFSEPGFQGSCVILGVGNYPDLSALVGIGAENTASIQVGDNVMLTVFSQVTYLGRGETFLSMDSNLSDNLVGADTASSIKVQARNSLPSTPRLVYPANNAAFTNESSFSLSWQNSGGGTQFQARLLLNSIEIQNSGWQPHTYWHVSSLAPGTYTWQVKSANHFGESAWSSPLNLAILFETPSITPGKSIPYFDDLESLATDWSNSNYWDLTNEMDHTENGVVSWFYDTNSTGYDTGAPNSGYITTPPINLPAGEAAYLRFWYYHETESPGIHWDQRWVQISANNGPFTPIYQITDDPTLTWLSSPAIPLQAYAGMTVRIRFYFVTLDGELNQFEGWYIDDLSINLTPPPACLDADNAADSATQITYGSNYIGLICPAGDIDYFQFPGNPGDRIKLHLETSSLGSTLEAKLLLLDTDSTSILVDSPSLPVLDNGDILFYYSLQRPGTYYIKILGINHPAIGDLTNAYRFSITQMDAEDPLAQFIYPQDGQTISIEPFLVQVDASDANSGVSHVEFWWHSADWLNSNWISLGQDWDGNDGWSILLDSTMINTLPGIALFAQVFDKAENSSGIGSYNLHPPWIYLPIILR